MLNLLARRLAGASLAVGLLAVPPAEAAEAQDGAGVLRVCSDPDNMPFSNIKGEGFENRIAEILARDLGLRVDYTWGAEYRGFLRKTLRDGSCDVVMGLPTEFPGVKTTRPYYRSAYVFVTAPHRHAAPSSFDDPALRADRIGLPIIGIDGTNTPPATAVARRQLGSNVVGFPVWGDGEGPDPQQRMFKAVADGEVDVALAWGPTAGWYSKPFGDRIALTPILADSAQPQLRFSFPISVGVRKIDGKLRDRLQGALDRNRAEIAAVLADFGLPEVDPRAQRDAS